MRERERDRQKKLKREVRRNKVYENGLAESFDVNV